MSASQGSDRDHENPRAFAALLNRLWETTLTPRGRPYTLTEVSKKTGLSVSYLSYLRSGSIPSVPFNRVEDLARFFDVPLDYFSQYDPPIDTPENSVEDALKQPLVQKVTLRAGKVGVRERALILQMLEQADRLLQEQESESPPAAPPVHKQRSTRPGQSGT